MFYEVAGKNIDLSGEVTTEQILKDIIDADQNSQKKQEMTEGVNYYATSNDILAKDFREYWVDGIKYVDYNKSNELIVNNLHKKLVDQKVGYIASKPVVVKSEDEELMDKVIFAESFEDIARLEPEFKSKIMLPVYSLFIKAMKRDKVSFV